MSDDIAPDFETILVRAAGGPDAGDHFVPLSAFGEWPPPEQLEGSRMFETTKPVGVYRRTSYSSLPPQEPGGHLMRGVSYEWVERTS